MVCTNGRKKSSVVSEQYVLKGLDISDLGESLLDSDSNSEHYE